MEYNATERSNCGVNFTTEDLDQLESVEEMYFKTREIEEEDDEDDYSDSNSSSDDEGDDADRDEAVEIMEIYKTERSKVQAFYSETCKCKMGMGEMACSATLSLDDITECRNNCSELSSAELDLVILGIIHSSLNCSETSISGRKYCCHLCREKGLTAELKIILIMLSRLWPNFSKRNLFLITKAENVVVIRAMKRT